MLENSCTKIGINRYGTVIKPTFAGNKQRY